MQTSSFVYVPFRKAWAVEGKLAEASFVLAKARRRFRRKHGAISVSESNGSNRHIGDGDSTNRISPERKATRLFSGKLVSIGLNDALRLCEREPQIWMVCKGILAGRSRRRKTRNEWKQDQVHGRFSPMLSGKRNGFVQLQKTMKYMPYSVFY